MRPSHCLGETICCCLLQGTGTTLVEIAPNGTFSQFAQIDPTTLPGPCPGGVGLTTALVVLRSGWVIVGSLPTTDGTSATAQAGCLIVLDSNGNVVETITDPQINGPWDMTVSDAGGGDDSQSREATLFVTNVLNGTVAANGNVVNQGTVVRIKLRVSTLYAPTVESLKVIGSDFSERTDPAALVIGPTGVALSKNGDTLYVADTLNNRIHAQQQQMAQKESQIQALQQAVQQQAELAAEQAKIEADKAAIAATNKRFSELGRVQCDRRSDRAVRQRQNGIEPQYRPQLLQLAQGAETVDGYVIQVKGFASAVGSAALNQKLSMSAPTT